MHLVDFEPTTKPSMYLKEEEATFEIWLFGKGKVVVQELWVILSTLHLADLRQYFQTQSR